MPPSPSHDRRIPLPVFVFPTSLTFVTEDLATHKQVLTVYNPYEFRFKYKVLCTAPTKYTVADSEGTVRPKRCVDIVIRHSEINQLNEHITDKFRIQIYNLEEGQKKILGFKDVPSTLVPRRERTPSGDERFESLPVQVSGAGDSQPAAFSRHMPGVEGTRPGVWTCFLLFMCGMSLLLPSTGTTNSSLPEYMHLSENQKIVAAFILGLTTMVFIRAL